MRATPLAKKLAREQGVRLSEVTGTGPSGRIIADDIRKAVTSATPVVVQEKSPIVESVQRLIPFTGMRKAVAHNMLVSETGAAQTVHEPYGKCLGDSGGTNRLYRMPKRGSG